MTGQTPLYGIRYPDTTTKVVNLGAELERFAGDVERVLAAATIPAATPVPTVVALTAQARDAYWGIPGTETARRTLQDRGATTIRPDRGTVERYFATYNASSNSGGATPPGWYPAGEAARLAKTGAQKTSTTSLGTTIITFTGDSIAQGLWNSNAPSRISIRRPGNYTIRANCRLDDQTGGYAILRIAVNGGAYSDTENLTSSFAAGGAYLHCSDVMRLSPGDYIEAHVYSSETSRNITANLASLAVMRAGD